MTGMLVRIDAIYCISVEYIWHTRLNCCLEELLEEVFCLYYFFELECVIGLTLCVEYLELFTECILKTSSICFVDLMWIEECPVSIFFDSLHEEVWN